MRVVIAPDCYTGTLSAREAADAMELGWRRAAAGDAITTMPLSDGGPGFIDVLADALGERGSAREPDDGLSAELLSVTVSDPLGRPAPASLLLVAEQGPTIAEEASPEEASPAEASAGAASATGRRTAYIETAQAAGLHLLSDEERDPTRTTTRGVGELIAAALDAGATRIVLGLGGSGTNDGGAGMLAALGAGPDERLDRGGLALEGIREADLSGLAAVRERLRGVEIVIASDVDNPLLGLQGASATFAEQKGATPEQAQELERALGAFAHAATSVLPSRTDLLTGSQTRLEREPGAGAAGGLGFGLYLLGGHRISGVGAVLDATGFDALVAESDIVVTGEGCLDWQSLHGKVVIGVAQAAARHAVPCIAVPGQSLVGRRETMTAGLHGVYPVAESLLEVDTVMADPAGTLAARTERVARTWSR